MGNVEPTHVPLTRSTRPQLPGGRGVTLPKKVCSDDFKKGAVDQVIGRRYSISSVAKRLGFNYDTLRKRVEDARYNSATSLIPSDFSG